MLQRPLEAAGDHIGTNRLLLDRSLQGSARLQLGGGDVQVQRPGWPGRALRHASSKIGHGGSDELHGRGWGVALRASEVALGKN